MQRRRVRSATARFACPCKTNRTAGTEIFKVRNAMQKQARDRLLYERYRPNLHRPMLPMHPGSRERRLRAGSIVAIPSCNPGVPPGPTEH